MISIQRDEESLIDKYLQEFYKQMNREALYLGLKNSSFSSAHGMHHD